LQVDSDRNWEDLLPPDPLDDLLLEKLRQRFTPETVVPEEMTVRPKDERRRKAGLTDYLLDYDQEWAVKSDLDISPEGQNVSSDIRLNIINGVAGSGKTLILLYRLRILHRNFPGRRFLVLTHNKPLSHDLQSRYNRIEGGLPENIEWATFQGWCHAHWPRDLKWIKPLSRYQREKLARQAWEKHLKDSTLTFAMFLSELDWFKDQSPMNRPEYLSAVRRGRGFGLTSEQREQVFTAMLAYQKSLGEGKRDWWDIPRLVWKAMQEGDTKFPSYDFVLIDEAQFFAPLWIQIVLKTLVSGSSHLFIVADPTQGFLGRGTSWKSLGLDARGRTHLMRRSYRTTREILSFASLLYRQRLAGEEDEDILVPDLLDMPNGAFPEVIPLTSPQDEIARAANEVADFVKQGLPRKHLLLLHPNGEGVKALVQAIEDRLGRGAAMDPKQTYPGDYVRVTTLNAGAGLESPIVFLVGLRELFEQEQSLRLSDAEREALVRDNTRKLYMAATRAGQRLVIT
jgi:superfamily I DNA/RNA helicase